MGEDIVEQTKEVSNAYSQYVAACVKFITEPACVW